jgi:hypothetical protein
MFDKAAMQIYNKWRGIYLRSIFRWVKAFKARKLLKTTSVQVGLEPRLPRLVKVLAEQDARTSVM